MTDAPGRFFAPYAKDGTIAPQLAGVRDRNGVYVIKARDSGRILYVGESHSRALTKTVLRHFQHWVGDTAGAKYRRDGVTVWLRPFPSGDDAVRWQNRLITSLEPRDNVQGTETWMDRLAGKRRHEVDDDVPF